MRKIGYITFVIFVSVCYLSYADSYKHYANKSERAQNKFSSGEDKDRRINYINIEPNKKDSINKHRNKGGKRSEKPVKRPQKANHALYRDVQKINGWWVGRGRPLSKDVASHLNLYYKLSKPNQKGHWTMVEAFDGYGKPQTNHSLGTYLVNQFDDADTTVTYEWKQKLLSVCKWNIVGDFDGDDVVQEQGLDSAGNIVFCYNPVKVGENSYVGSYTDAWGLPVLMRADNLGNGTGYANYVKITRDALGREVLFSFIDRNGCPYLNKDGAYQTERRYNASGYQTMEASLDIAGNRMTDSWGNCGFETHYDKNGFSDYAIYKDADWNPIRMPIAREGAIDVVRKNWKYDEYGRIIEEYYTNNDGTILDTTCFGLYKKRFEYNKHGVLTRMTGYDIKDNPAPLDGKYAIADIIINIDDKTGLVLGGSFKDKDGKFTNNADGVCKYLLEYDGSKLIHNVSYSMVGDSCLKSHEYTIDRLGNEDTKWYLKNIHRIDSVDQQGRPILTLWQDLDGNPINGYDSSGFHEERVQYSNDGHIVTWMDKDGDPFYNYYNNNDCSRMVFKEDTINHIETLYKYYRDFLLNIFQKKISPETDRILSQWDITPSGEHARVGWWNNLHYTCDVDYTIYGDIRTMVCKNEFNEPAYLVELWHDGGIYYFRDPQSDRYFDEYSKEIPRDSMNSFKEKLPQAFCIEVTDTVVGNKLGLNNGDIILSYGDWHLAEDLNTNLSQFFVASIINAGKNKDMYILRHYPKKEESKILQVPLPEGSWEELGFYPHHIYYTQKEKERLVNTCSKNGFQLDSSPEVTGRKEYVILPIKGGVMQTQAYHFNQIAKAPGLILSQKYQDDKDFNWNILDYSDDELNSELYHNDLGGTLKVAYTTDNNNVTIANFNSETNFSRLGLDILPVVIDIQTSEALDSLCKRNEYILRERGAVKPISHLEIPLKNKNLAGLWTVSSQHQNSEGHYTSGNIYLSKDGKITGYLQEYATRKFDEGLAVFCITQVLDGTYNIVNNSIIITPLNTKGNYHVQCIDLIGADDNLKELAVTYLNELINDEELKNNLLNTLDYQDWLANGISILEYDKNSIKIDNGFPDGVILKFVSKKNNVPTKCVPTLFNNDVKVVQIEVVEDGLCRNARPKAPV